MPHAVFSASTLAQIPNLDTMEAEVFVLEADAGGLIEDLTAEVTLESRPDQVFQARIEKVDALAKRKIRWVPVQYFKAKYWSDRSRDRYVLPSPHSS